MLQPDPYDEAASQAAPTFRETAPVTEPLSGKKETGYPWLFFYAGRSWLKGLGLTLVVTGLGGISYVWYSVATHDTSPFSTPALIYATLGTIFLCWQLYHIRCASVCANVPWDNSMPRSTGIYFLRSWAWS